METGHNSQGFDIQKALPPGSWDLPTEIVHFERFPDSLKIPAVNDLGIAMAFICAIMFMQLLKLTI